MREIGDFASIDEHYAYQRLLCSTTVASAAERFDSVASAMQLGVHTLSGRIDVTEIITVPE